MKPHMVLSNGEPILEPSHITAGSSKDVTSQMYVGPSLLRYQVSGSLT